MKKQLFLIYLISIFLVSNLYGINGISILASRTLLENELVQKSVDDCLVLLKKACQCEVKINDRSQEILLFLPNIDTNNLMLSSTLGNNASYPYIDYPIHHYEWTSQRVNQQIHLQLNTANFIGISFGLYGLLQEQLWFAFYHPKESIIPNLEFWPLTEDFTWKATPRFEKKGFHLHTMHPLELTEPLLNPDCPNGIAQIKEYIDWLVRNQQNYFEFNLLESEDLNRWIDYIKPAVDYAHARGILIGLDVSLHMTQQKAFMLYQSFPASLKSAKKQIAQNLAILFQADWDIIAMETSQTEFTKGNESKTQALQLYITDLIVNKYHAHLAGRQHVVKNENLLNKVASADSLTQAQQHLDANRAVYIHTVMFYGLTDKKAPVYKNENLLHLLDLLKKEKEVRETWYFPESSYWITFDHSVPMLLMPYLQTRLDDILLMDSLNVKGHLTFSSGWEWGYWLIDWSIARWSWEHTFNHKTQKPRATQFLADLFQDQSIVDQFNNLGKLQQKYIKEDQLIRYMVAQTVTDELPAPFNIEFHPRPEKSYKWMRKRANQDDIQIITKNVIQPLLEFATLGDASINELSTQDYSLTATQNKILKELTCALSVTNLRAKHKAHTLAFLLGKRAASLNKTSDSNWKEHLVNAQTTRLQAQNLVTLQEQNYRYPIDLIARKIENGGKTAYDFGYLYPVSNLHFWKREEEQIIQDKYGPFFMSIWDIPRILGIVD
ncbi:hypothetical protein [Aureispira anguillae]|uniref:Uncharacterized protein n=1 Tax=Aureispira anguillae TaxID=2864201 RepID=A0A915YFL8_9BACT|nr:hypothetical protein [Aureispira anguillae]BDS12093.1 hypothetical protein AsAng_0028080 [Aureispira anguillae]